MLTAKVVEGRLDLPEGTLRDGEIVTLLVADSEEAGFRLSDAGAGAAEGRYRAGGPRRDSRRLEAAGRAAVEGGHKGRPYKTIT